VFVHGELPDKNIKDHENSENDTSHAIHSGKSHIDLGKIRWFNNQVFINQNGTENYGADPVKNVERTEQTSEDNQCDGKEVK